VTAHEFCDYCQRAENSTRRLDLTRGRVVEWPLPYVRHGLLASNVGSALRGYADRSNLGYVASGGVGIVLEDDPGTVRGPDVAFFPMTADPTARRWTDDRPVLAVEVRSGNDPPAEIDAMVDDLLRCGVPDVWLVESETRLLTAYRRQTGPRQFGVDDVVTATELPGLSVRVGDLYLMPAGRAALR
jgi:Uma2 family endonuclease